MSGADALLRLGSSASSAVAEALERFASGEVNAGDVAVLDSSSSSSGGGPLVGLPFPAVASSVRLGDGGGAGVFATTLEGARRLARFMMGAGEPADGDAAGDLDDFERSAVSEAMSRLMAAASGSLSEALGREAEVGSPETQTFETPAAAAEAFGATPHMVRAAFSVAGEPCRLVLMLPVGFVLGISSAEEGAAAAASDASAAVPPAGAAAAAALPAVVGRAPSLAGIPVRVWAELGRATMPTADVVELPPGAVVELDRGADEPIDLFVNGRRFATGRLIVVDGSDWAVRIESVLPDAGDEPHPA